MEGKVIEEIRNFLEWGVETLDLDRGFDIRGCFLLRLPAGSFGAAVVLGLDF